MNNPKLKEFFFFEKFVTLNGPKFGDNIKGFDDRVGLKITKK